MSILDFKKEVKIIDADIARDIAREILGRPKDFVTIAAEHDNGRWLVTGVINASGTSNRIGIAMSIPDEFRGEIRKKEMPYIEIARKEEE